MNKEYFLLYLIYGFTYIIMGIFSIQKKDIEVSNLPLVKSLKYLGYFGLSHGISEWITMVIIIELYPKLYIWLFILKQILKALSFISLIYFGLYLLFLDDENKRPAKLVTTILFLFWSMGFIYFIKSHGLDYHILNPKYNTIILRYFMAFPGGIISFMALHSNAKLLEKRKQINMAKRYKHLAYAFLIYGLLDGLLTKLIRYLNLPSQILNIMVGIWIIFLLIKVIDTFGWLQKEKLNRLQSQRVSYEERRKLGLEIHDSIMQCLYAAGLKVEFLIKSKADEKDNMILREIKDDLKTTIGKTREFLTSTALDTVELEDLNDTLQQLINRFNKNQGVKINLLSKISPLSLGQLSTEKSTQIYYMVQEAISNIIKHSKGTYGDVSIVAREDFLHIIIIDNGIGISIEDINIQEQFGISSMKERAERVGGIFNIEKIVQGTKVELMIPWEESNYEG